MSNRFKSTLTTLAVALGMAFTGAALAGNYGGKAPVAPMATGANYVVTGEQIISDDGTCSRVWVNIKGSVTGTTNDGDGKDNVNFELWDDGTLKDSEAVAVPVGSTILVDVTLEFEGLYLHGAAGVGVYEWETGLMQDPFYPTDVPGVCSVNPVKCWVAPNTVAKGGTVTFFAEVPNGANSVKAYNGDLQIANMTDPDGDGVYTGNWKVPATALMGWHRDLSIQAMTGKGAVWCLGVNVQKP